MRILYYIEPWVEYSKPSWNKDYIWWFGEFSKKLETVDSGVESFFLFNEAVSLHYTEFNRCNSKYNVILHKELKGIFQNNSEALMAWQSNKYSFWKSLQMQTLVKSKLKGFSPDVIFTITPVPFLKQLFPHALIIHRDAMYCREPFPDELTSFDPFGLYTNSYWYKNYDLVNSMELTCKQKDFLYEFRSIFLSQISSHNPLVESVLNMRKKFNTLLLLPLQSKDCFNFYSFYPTRCVFDYISSVFDQISPEIGVIVTQHPDDRTLSSDTTNYFKHKYPNFLTLGEECNNFHSPSQFVLCLVDGLLNLSSGLAYQALMHNKPIFITGNSHFKKMNCVRNLSKVGEFYKNNRNLSTNYDSVLYWLLTKYNFPYAYLHDPNWLFARINSFYRNKNMFPDIAPDLNSLLNAYNQNKREVRVLKY